MPASSLVVLAAAAQASVVDSTRILSINHTTWTTQDIARKYRSDNSGRLRRPRSQRNFAPGWRKRKQQHDLIDSIFHNYPVGSLILNKVYDNPDDTDAWYDIYDGRHRIETITKFVNNEFKYNGLLYKDLSVADRKLFNERKISVTELAFDVETPTERQTYVLADVFIRLNKGIKLTDSDLCWANRDAPMIRTTIDILEEYEIKLSTIFGGCKVHNRTDLANWVALIIGLSTRSAANISTSYLRIAPLAFQEPNMTNIRNGLDAIVRMYTRANAESPVSDNALKAYYKTGFVNAFFVADLFRPVADWAVVDEETGLSPCDEKWIGIINRLRNATTVAGMTFALKTKGAQNLNIAKVTQVLQQVDEYLASGVGSMPAVADSDEEEDSDVE